MSIGSDWQDVSISTIEYVSQSNLHVYNMQTMSNCGELVSSLMEGALYLLNAKKKTTIHILYFFYIFNTYEYLMFVYILIYLYHMKEEHIY